MNTELVYPDAPEVIFHIKHQALTYGKQFTALDRFSRIKGYETWAQAICLKAYGEKVQNYNTDIFPSLSNSQIAILKHRRWQLDKIFKFS